MKLATDKPPVTNAYNSKDRNAVWVESQAELWNGRLAMIGLPTLGFSWL